MASCKADTSRLFLDTVRLLFALLQIATVEKKKAWTESHSRFLVREVAVSFQLVLEGDEKERQGIES